MSYSEKDGQVILTMSKDDYDRLMIYLGLGISSLLARGSELREMLECHNRVNAGNPKYVPYKVNP